MRQWTTVALVSFAVATPALLVAQKKLSYDDVRKPLRWESGAPSAAFVSGGKHVQYSGGWWSKCIDPATGDSVEPERAPTKPVTELRRVAYVRDGALWLD